MRRTLSTLLVTSMAFAGWPMGMVAELSASSVVGELAASASGNVETVGGLPVSAVGIRARNLDTGGAVGTAITDSRGQFQFAELGPGAYIFEAFGQSASVVGTSSAISLAPGAAVEDVAITVPESSQSTPAYIDDDGGGNGKAKYLLGALAAAGIALGLYALVEANESISDDEISDAVDLAALTGEPAALGYGKDRGFVVAPGSCFVCPPAAPAARTIPSRPASPCR